MEDQTLGLMHARNTPLLSASLLQPNREVAWDLGVCVGLRGTLWDRWSFVGCMGPVWYGWGFVG